MDFSKETILVVDDSRFQRTVIKKIFSEYFNIIEATSGGECMRIIQENASDIDLVLLDLVMPGIDGLEVLRRRQNISYFLDIPVIVLTTSDSTIIQANAYELGANDFLTKPINKKIALSRIQNLLKSKHRLKSLMQKYVEAKVKSELDGMTGLFNKTTTINLINDTLSQKPTFCHAFLIVDIDNFKAINDIFGHTVGDHTISIISNIIVSQFSVPDLVGRIGGDEFVIFVPEVKSKKDIYNKTEALVNIISDKEDLSIPDSVTISIGLAFSDEAECNYNTLFSMADEALYTSKHAGKSCYTEYGTTIANSEMHSIMVVSSSRNVLSMLEFAYDQQVNITHFLPSEDMITNILSNEFETSCIYIDISYEKDNGKNILELVNNASINTPIVIICQEGCVEQIRNAVSYEFTKDVLFSPLETATLKRRITEHIQSNF